MTEKLYYLDAYISKFDAEVLSCEPDGERFLVRLDRTAFFPEEGGQTADTGYISSSRVVDVREKDGTVYHYCEAPLTVGERVKCVLDFQDRIEKMRSHTAEHIVCGIINRLFGFVNVGFHLGTDTVTFDISGVLSREELDRVEELANKVVLDNLPVRAYFPTSEELSTLTYRSKLDLREGVRIVSIGDIDNCACCAPHVNATGEIGIIKLLDFMKHRGGTRVTLVAGMRALYDYRQKYKSVYDISGLLSTPQSDIAPEVARVLEEKKDIEHSRDSMELLLAGRIAESIPVTEGNLVLKLDLKSVDSVREVANIGVSRVGGILVLLTGEDGNYRYIIASSSRNLGELSGDINSALFGRGGGRPEMLQGSFYTDIVTIRNYFSSL